MPTDEVRSLAGLNYDAVASLARAMEITEGAAALGVHEDWWEEILELVRSSADPAGVLQRLEAIAAAADGKSLATALADSPRLREGLVGTLAASRSIAHHLESHPEDVALVGSEPFEPITDPTLAIQLAIAACHRGGLPAQINALRLHKRREYLRIAAADLLGELTVEAVGAALSALATACLEAALTALAAGSDRPPIAVIAMGKLGGNELNYASDVDIVFACTDEADTEKAISIAERLMAAINGDAPVDVIFRMDADLRPEGRAGPLVRSLASYKTYWAKWADPWEFQALLKARPVAGDIELGNQLVAAAAEHVWPERLDPEAIRSIRALKARGERSLAAKGISQREFKRGPGGIRDIEFAVQLLQMVHGRHDEALRAPGTLDALEGLADGGYIDREDAVAMGGAYRFLRIVEHRLQLRDERQVYELPERDDDLDHLARTLGFRDRANATAAEIFSKAYTQNALLVRGIHQRVYFRPLLEAFASARKGAPSIETMSQSAAEERLGAFGFTDIRRARAGLEELTRGLSRASRLMQQLLPLMMEWLSEAPDPDLGLVGLRNVVGSAGDNANLVTTFRENPPAAQRLCTILGTSRILAELLVQEPETLGTLSDESSLESAKSPDEIRREAGHFIGWRESFDDQLVAINRFHRREFLRVAMRDLIAGASVSEVGGGLAAVGGAVLEVALRSALEDCPGPEINLSVIGMGSLGGQEMGYSSDLDVIFIYDAPSIAAARERAHEVTSRLLDALGGVTARGVAFRLDADLRPEGKAGPLARSLDSAIAYYDQWAESWEFQAMTKARHVAGERRLTDTLLTSISSRVWPDQLAPERAREIRMMKARMERDRVPAGEDAKFHLKLGPGGLTDVEFAAQLLALRHCGTHPEVRNLNTLETLDALMEAGLLDSDAGRRLSEGYEFCTRVRNRLFLIKGRQVDSLPGDTTESRRLGESLGFAENPRAELREEYRRVTRRARAAFEEVFFGD